MTTRSGALALAITTVMALTVGLTACGSDTSSGVPPASAPVDTTPPESPSTPVTEPPDAAPTTSLESEPSATVNVVIDDGTFASPAEMAASSTLVAVGDVVERVTIGRPDLPLDPAADEYVAITVRPTETLVGSAVDELVIAWNAYAVDADGSRTAIRVMNGLRPPTVGDHVLIFVNVADPAATEHLGGAPTHQLVKLDGLVYLDGERVVAGEANSPVVDQMIGRTIADLRADLLQ